MNSREFSSLLKRIRRATHQVAPASVWTNRTKADLMLRVKRDLAQVPQTSFSETVLVFFQSFLPLKAMSLVRGPALALLAILAVVTGGSIASVSAAEQSVPGDFLYPLKLAREQASIMMAKSKTEKLRLKTEYVGRRVDEIQVIATSDTPKPEKGERIKQAAEVLKRDFDTVKVQLSEAKEEANPREMALSAKLLDEKTTQAMTQLKDVKLGVESDVRAKVVEVQAAAMNTGVKAVQVLIDTKDEPDVQTIVTGEDIVLSIQQKVQGIADNVSESEQKLVTVGLVTASHTQPLVATTSSTMGASSTTTIVDFSVASSSVEQIKNVKQVLDQTRQLVGENKLSEARNSLDQASKAAVTLEVSVANIVTPLPVTSSTQMLPSTSSTNPLQATSSTSSTTSSSEGLKSPTTSSSSSIVNPPSSSTKAQP